MILLTALAADPNRTAAICLMGVPFGIIIPHIIGSPLETASGWRDWFYVCIGCVVVFIPFIFTMYGHWSPRKARTEYQAHAELVAAELARLTAAAGPAAA